ncbi:MAG: hypothetical protein FWC34_03450 [Bacteroidetes bacterium]|nr:hypothetical protein [Bacteroidota bacterium]
MKKSYLFPNYLKKIGYCIAIPFIIILILNVCNVPYLNFDFKTFGILVHSLPIFSSETIDGTTTMSLSYDMKESIWLTTAKTNFQGTIVPVTIIIGLLLIAFSKEKIEDEMIVKIREQSLIWAVLVNFIILILGILFVFGFSYLYFLSFQIFFVLILFIAKFNFELYRFNKSVKYEE